MMSQSPAALPTLLTSAALLASAGSVHCIGMCGGISSALTFSIPESRRQGKSLWGWQLLFGIGRVTTYMVLGALAGMLGKALLDWLPGPSMAIGLSLSGVLMLLLSGYLLGQGVWLKKLEGIGAGLWRRLQPLTRRLLPVDRPLKALALGGLWGLLPCGLIYTALALAVTSGSALAGALVMLVFGVVTVIPVAITGVIASRLQHFRNGIWPKVAASLTFLLALVFFWQAWSMSQMPHHGHHGAVDENTQRHHHQPET
ncbi:sulfite exporter TauE/SafE family protein [Alcanivorax sp.]|jgi:sulfite exporter TauE/SafE|uniref:sulfite exporter TauE/SafE family protein n=1 Tax=Alcanivorax sp. TaxID=1872427 RepID=UPI0025C1DB34|nr:sulfite exporter TauE/SafE family protein [Alcanivorax sp.]